ncbi:MAG: GntR family transcriptional regulator [Pseudomonadota bacterium]
MRESAVHMKKNKTTQQWKAETPIYRQIMDILIEAILRSDYHEGALLPSVRQIAATYDVSTITGAKVLKELELAGIAIKRLGIGWEIKKGVRIRLLKTQRETFFKEEWPDLQRRLELMEIDLEDLMRAGSRKRGS